VHQVIIKLTVQQEAAIESRWLLMSIYNLFLTLALVIVVGVTVVENDDDTFYLAAVMIEFSVSRYYRSTVYYFLLQQHDRSSVAPTCYCTYLGLGFQQQEQWVSASMIKRAHYK
jgi:hypothetical protein